MSTSYPLSNNSNTVCHIYYVYNYSFKILLKKKLEAVFSFLLFRPMGITPWTQSRAWTRIASKSCFHFLLFWVWSFCYLGIQGPIFIPSSVVKSVDMMLTLRVVSVVIHGGYGICTKNWMWKTGKADRQWRKYINRTRRLQSASPKTTRNGAAMV